MTAISVGVFLVIVIGAAIVVFPSLDTQAAAVRGGVPSVPGALTWEPERPAVSAAPVPAEAAGGRESLPGGGLPALPEKEEASAGATAAVEDAGNRGAVSDGNKVVISVPVPGAVAVPIAPPQAKPANTAKPKPPAAPAPAVKPAPAAKPAPAKAAQKAKTSYWVQTGSFSAQAHAESARETLKNKGITSIIENREIGGKTWFRVKVGPYTSQSEANYWFALIKNIDGFEGSLVWKDES